MIKRLLLPVLLVLVFSFGATAQIISKTTNVGPQISIGGESSDNTTYRLWQIGSDIQYRSPLESPGGSVSALDLKAPGKARREYDKGYQLLMRKDLQGAIQHLTAATTIYPNFVAAHSALGSAYMGLSQSEQARAEFAQALTLDGHLPSSHLNLACAELALQHFSAAQDSLRKASAMAPLDLHLLTALVYGEFMNHDYAEAVTTAGQVHGRVHTGFAKVHLYAAASWEAQGDLAQAQQELETFLREDPKSPNAGRVLQMIQQLKEQPQAPVAAAAPEVKISYTKVQDGSSSGPAQLPENFRKLMQDSKETQQIVEAEAEESCPNCAAAVSSRVAERGGSPAPSSRLNSPIAAGPYTLRASADEVAVFFAATDHGKSVTNLTGKDIGIRDDRRAPAAITGFRNESELPLRLGIVIDTSSSVTERFKFEQESATAFLQKVVTGPSDLAFVVGVANSILLVQDFTAEQNLLSGAVGQLVPSGGTALWDAVAFAADKLASRPEDQPVARIIVVLSDGEDNSSTATLKQAVNRAQHGEVTVYTISTRVIAADAANSSVGEHGLKTLAQLTGGAAFTPGSVQHLSGSLADLQQVIRSRYLISYKPAGFKRDGQYRAINITAAKGGHKLHVYARKGYFASVDTGGAERF